MENADVAVVVRMYNEATRVGAVVSELKEHFPTVVCVDDGSTDGSGEVARAAGAIVVRHLQNLGGGAALETGFAWVRRHPAVQWCVTFDADGQHRVQDARALLERARRDGVDVVLSTRFAGETLPVPAVRRTVLRAATWFTRATTGMGVTDAHHGLRVLSRNAVSRIRLRQRGFAYASELLAAVRRSGLTWAEHPAGVIYDEYSMAKGQRNLNAVNIIFDLTAARLKARP